MCVFVRRAGCRPTLDIFSGLLEFRQTVMAAEIIGLPVVTVLSAALPGSTSMPQIGSIMTVSNTMLESA